MLAVLQHRNDRQKRYTGAAVSGVDILGDRPQAGSGELDPVDGYEQMRQ
nr:hypothetical protein [Rhodococcus globerulus]